MTSASGPSRVQPDAASLAGQASPYRPLCDHKGQTDWCQVCGSYRPDRLVVLPEARHPERPQRRADFACCAHCGNPHIERKDGVPGHPTACGQYDCAKGKTPILAAGNEQVRNV